MAGEISAKDSGVYRGNWPMTICDDTSDDPSETTASAFCSDWIARSNKQAFLPQMGAGTIDQALLAILPARSQVLQLWGLADKVLGSEPT